MSYLVVFESRALKQLYSFPKDMLARLRQKTNELEQNPRPAGAIKLTGNFQGGYRIRVGSVRVLYSVDDKERTVRIFDVEPRDKAYEKR